MTRIGRRVADRGSPFARFAAFVVSEGQPRMVRIDAKSNCPRDPVCSLIGSRPLPVCSQQAASGRHNLVKQGHIRAHQPDPRHPRSMSPDDRTLRASSVPQRLRGEPQSQDNALAAWYSVTRVSKKFFSFERSIVSDIQGKGFFEPYWVGRPMRSRRRSATCWT